MQPLEADIQDIMNGIFNVPMLASSVQKGEGLRGQTGNQITEHAGSLCLRDKY